MKKALWLLEAGLFIIFSLPLAILPFKVSIKAGEMLGLLLFYIWGSRRRIAIENIEKSAVSFFSSANPLSSASRPRRPACGQLSAISIARETFKNLGRSFTEIVKIYYGFGKNIIDSVEIAGVENFNKARANGKGILFLTGHCGNWELLGTAVAANLADIAIVARPINNPYINKFIVNGRQRHGNSIIAKQGALKVIIKRLRDGGCVGILMDQSVLSDEGYVIDFLGRGAWTTKMPALIARKTGAAVLPVFIHRTDRGHGLKIYPEVELSNMDDKEKAALEDTKKFSGFIEGYIKEHPFQWLWIHRRWKRV
ncbi:MAG: lysophospholipid acyltransferase family protein [Thermodesulfovibrionales bacterium]|nr:lysophospholipid acyltransferase family protein [Thermodesulfovibrionales bacterium]